MSNDNFRTAESINFKMTLIYIKHKWNYDLNFFHQKEKVKSQKTKKTYSF